jgi:hypothetical protein
MHAKHVRQFAPCAVPGAGFPRKTPPGMYAQIWVRQLEPPPLTTFACTPDTIFTSDVHFSLYNAHGHIMPVGYKLRFPPSEKVQFMTALGIILL